MSARAVATVYSHERLATTLKLQPFFEWATETCGRVFKRLLTTDEEKRREIYEEFIVKYSVDMSDYRLQHYSNFTSVNDWFIRELRDDARPIAAPNDSAVVVSPADARVVVFQNVPPDHRAWIKGARFSVSSLLDDHPGINMSAFAAGASLAIVRLAPQDYHRFHAPVAGTITHQYRVDGLLHSVNSDAMRSDNDAIFNQRIVTIIENPRIGPVAFVAIGALCVGSVQMTRVEGATVAKGEELGYFQFGGSTIALLLPSRALGLGAVFDDDLVVHSRYLVETRVLMGQQIARQP
jgi:phosphatidylserine decarboxylase